MSPSSIDERRPLDESRSWVGGEAALDPQVANHMRRREHPGLVLAAAVLGLAFAGGVALGAVLNAIWRGRSHRSLDPPRDQQNSARSGADESGRKTTRG
jgi:hypothetical protein